MSVDLLSFSNPVLSKYAFYGTVVVLKMFLLALLTVYQRGQKQVCAALLVTFRHLKLV